MPTRITLESGAVLDLDFAAPEPAEELLSVIMLELKQVNFSGSFDLEDLSSGDLNTFKDLVCQALGSRALRDAVYACAAKSLYNGQRITRQTFATPEARADFFLVAWEVVKLNIGPFFANLGLKSWVAKLMPGNLQKSVAKAFPSPDSEPSA